MLHRYIAGLLGLYVFFISYISIKFSNKGFKLPLAMSILIIIQAIMGMLTVTMLVKPTIVTTHLFLGMLTATLLFMNGVRHSEFVSNNFTFSKPLVVLISFTWLFLLAQIILGGWTSTNYASLACTDFPKCLDQWYPKELNYSGAFNISNLPDINYEGGVLAYDNKVAIHFLHRFSALVLSVLFAIMMIILYKSGVSENFKKLCSFTILFFLLQIILGITNVVYSLPLTVAVWHTMNAAILMMLMTTMLYLSLLSNNKEKK